MTTTPFTPITREMACEVLSISMGTLDALIADGTLPRPAALGRRRLLYWHPEDFYGVLDRALRQLATEPSTSAEPTAPLVGRSQPAKREGGLGQTPSASKGTAADRAKARNAARIKKLNS